MNKIMNWRPDDWENDKFHACMQLTEGGGTYKDIYEVFEAGADAMLEALKERGSYSSPEDQLLAVCEIPRRKGWAVVIPDEE